MPALSRAHAAFGRALRELRKEHPDNLSQDRLAAKSQLDRSYVASVERGEHNISLTNVLKLALALNRRPSELLTRFEAMIDWGELESDGLDGLIRLLRGNARGRAGSGKPRSGA